MRSNLKEAMEIVAKAARDCHPAWHPTFRFPDGRVIAKFEPDDPACCSTPGCIGTIEESRSADAARFDERVQCAVLVMNEFSDLPANMANRAWVVEMGMDIAKAILARGAK